MSERRRVIMLLDNPLKADARVEKEALTLTGMGYQVDIYATESEHLPIEETKPFGKISRTISNAVDRPFSSQYRNFRTTFVRLIADQDFQVLHCHDYKMLLLGAEIKKKKPGIFLIYDSHEFLKGWPHYKDLKGRWNRLKGLVVWAWFVAREKKAIAFANAVITVSDSIAAALQKENGLAKKPIVLRNIPEAASLSTKKDLHTKFEIPLTAKILVHSGGLYHSATRINMMMDVAGEFEDLYLIFVGGYDKMQALKETNTRARVRFHDYVDRAQLITLLSSANFGIVHTWQPQWPSHWYSLPNRVMEYSQAGLPVVATSQPEFILLGKQYGHIVFYEGNDRLLLRAAIQSAIDNEGTLKEKAMKARSELNWEKESQKLVQLYNKIK